MTLPLGFTHLPGWYTGPAIVGTLTRELPWRQESVSLYGKVHKEPRLTCWMGDAPYTYSGVRHEPTPMHPVVQAIRELLQVELECEFNSVLANCYRDGADSVAWHSDDEPELGPEPLIASVSLGGSRKFKVRETVQLGACTRQVWDVTLADGDLLVMRGRSQLDYQHALPKTAREVLPRVNLTFRTVAP